MIEDVIAAISTPLGEAGLSVIRVSGQGSIELADKIFRFPAANKTLSKASSHTIHYGFVFNGEEKIDEVMVNVLRSPRTFTCEDTVEFQCHGGLYTTKLVLNTILEAGARLAVPGEFTKRAFVNGRIDLAQAEAVADLIHARSQRTMRVAHDQLKGRLSREVENVREDIMNVLAHVEAHIDFPDEDIAPDTQGELEKKITGAIDYLKRLIDTAYDGRLLRRGIRTAIVGKPNAGKSSLLNILLGEDRAIVSSVPGTTRDTIEEHATINGIPILFIDTAGLRDSDDEIEKEGIRRSMETLSQADLILHVFDASVGMDSLDEKFLNENPSQRIISVANKCDLQDLNNISQHSENFVPISCHTNQGIDELKKRIENIFWKGGIDSSQDQVMINSRHEDLLVKAKTSLENTLQSLHDDWSLEVAAMELRMAANLIGEIVGKTSTEDLLDKIFSEFCLGK